ncbi:phosphotransferase family protein [Methylobacterium radiodurans]|uniref:Aminoglycoside phosphotransferase family protein n=1 Tax=Methylobacterium radiodurans TaxID=2202828 RepID=A0A2U8VWS0_9HYPH|nr:aminoglycoside phosphotransferase family protein [Methylobacterium radiodurans]AWN38247.1 aminoglycoside phosphotransferase family protein [Methylobacterium radiodurans]
MPGQASPHVLSSIPLAPDPAHRLGIGRSAEVFADAPGRVLKLFVEGSDPEAIAAEFRAARLAHGQGLPAPRAHAVVAHGARTGILFDRVEGRSLLRHCGMRPDRVMLGFRSLALLQRRIHARSGAGLPDQRAVLREGIVRARISEGARTAALARLERLPGGEALCHGDLHPENVLVTPGGWRVVDWQKAVAGHPAADAARTAMLIRFGRVVDGPRAAATAAPLRALVAFWYTLCYRRGPGPRVGLADIRAWTLPVAAARLAGRIAENEDALRAEVERLAAEAA